MASGITHGSVRTTATTTTAESRNMVVIALANGLTEMCSLVLQRTSMILDIYVMVNGHLLKQGIR